VIGYAPVGKFNDNWPHPLDGPAAAEHDAAQYPLAALDQFRSAITQIARSVSVVTLVLDGQPYGATVSGFESLSIGPPMMLVSLNRHPGAKRLQFEVARKMCDEHRAERNTIGTYGSHPPTVKDVLDILGHMGEQLADAFTRFEQSANREQLRTDVYNACAPVWTWVAYWAAEYRDADGVGPVPDNIAQLKL
jgi:Flavin reductase like domain